MLPPPMQQVPREQDAPSCCALASPSEGTHDHACTARRPLETRRRQDRSEGQQQQSRTTYPKIRRFHETRRQGIEM